MQVVINAIIEEEQNDKALAIIHSYGVSGATQIKSRAVLPDQDAKILSIPLDKRMSHIIVVCELEESKKISQELYNQLQLELEGKGNVYVIPVI